MPCTKCARRIFATVSTISIPPQAPYLPGSHREPHLQRGHFWTPITPPRGSFFHAESHHCSHCALAPATPACKASARKPTSLPVSLRLHCQQTCSLISLPKSCWPIGGALRPRNCTLRRHPTAIRLTLLAAFCHVRGREIIDALVDLLIVTVHRIGATAKKQIESELIAPKTRCRQAGAAVQARRGKPGQADTVRAVVFPVVDEQTLRDLVAEREATGPITFLADVQPSFG